jgi:hypothetical protein
MAKLSLRGGAYPAATDWSAANLLGVAVLVLWLLESTRPLVPSFLLLGVAVVLMLLPALLPRSGPKPRRQLLLIPDVPGPCFRAAPSLQEPHPRLSRRMPTDGPGSRLPTRELSIMSKAESRGAEIHRNLCRKSARKSHTSRDGGGKWWDAEPDRLRFSPLRWCGAGLG